MKKTIGTSLLLAAFTFSMIGCNNSAPAHKHSWSEPTYIWADDFSSCTAERRCLEDESHQQIETRDSVYSVIDEATCEDDGVGRFTVTFSNKAFLFQTHDIVLPALGHNWGEITYSWSDDNSSCTAIKPCLNDDSHSIKETVQSTYKEIKEATRSEEGEGQFTATFNNAIFEEQVKVVAIPKIVSRVDISFKGNKLFNDELNNGLKDLLNSRNFTVNYNDSIIESCGKISDLIGSFEKPNVEMDDYIAISVRTIESDVQLELKDILTKTGYDKYVNNDRESEEITTVQHFFSQSDLLAFFNKNSLDELKQNPSVHVSTSYSIEGEVREVERDLTLSMILGLYKLQNTLGINDLYAQDGNVIVSENQSHYKYAILQDESTEQFVAYNAIKPNESFYVNPHKYNAYSTRLSFLEQYMYGLNNSNVIPTYDADAHKYEINHIGSGGGYADYRSLNPFIVENGEIISIGGGTITNKGSTVIDTKYDLPSCSGHSDTFIDYFDENYLGEYCAECGKLINKIPHVINNDHNYSTVLEGMVDQILFENYSPSYYDGELSGNPQVSPINGKVYFDDANGASPISGDYIISTDNNIYKYHESTPETTTGEPILLREQTARGGYYLEESLCVFVREYDIYLISDYAITYQKLSEELVLEDDKDRYDANNGEYYLELYDGLTYSEFLKSTTKKDKVDTWYTYPRQGHEGYAFKQYLSLQETIEKYPSLFTNMELNPETEAYFANGTFIEVECTKCGKTLVAFVNYTLEQLSTMDEVTGTFRSYIDPTTYQSDEITLTISLS